MSPKLSAISPNLLCVLMVSMAGCAATGPSGLPPQHTKNLLTFRGSGRGYYPCNGYESQRAQNWCWAASVTAVINGVTDRTAITQEQVASQLFGGKTIDQGATAQQIAGVIDGSRFTYQFPVGGGRLTYTLKAVYTSGMPTPAQLEQWADGNHGIILLVPHHAVVLTGAEWADVGGDFAIEWAVDSIDVWDPWPRRGNMVVTKQKFKEKGGEYCVEGAVIVTLQER